MRPRPVRRVLVARLGERRESGSRLLEFANSGQHVDHGLGGKPRDRGGADVVNPALEPEAEGLLEKRPLGLEPARPLRVVGDDHDTGRGH